MAYLKKSQTLKPKASAQLQQAREADLQHMSTKELRSYIANEGKRLNQQIVEIEKQGKEREAYAYQKLTSQAKYRDYLGTTKSGHIKVNLATRGMSRPEMQKVANIIQQFSQAQTMTVSGIKQYYHNVYEGMRQKYTGMKDLTDEQIADIINTEGFFHAMGTIGSDTVMKLIEKSAGPQYMMKFLEAAGSLNTQDESITKYNEIMKTSGNWTTADDLPLDFNIFNDELPVK